MNDRRDRWTSNISYFVLALVIAFIFGVVFFWLLFIILVSLFPSVAHFEGRTYPVMPMGQALLSFLLTIIASIIVLVVAFKKIKQKFTSNRGY